MEPRIWLIAGPTASGKSALALRLAEASGAEIVNADSMQLYAGLRVLTAGPGPEETARAPHHLFGSVDPADGWSVGRWLRAASEVIADIRGRGRPVVVVGGTGLYFRALTQGLAEIPEVPADVRAKAAADFERMGEAAFRTRLAEVDPAAAARIAPGDRQRLCRAWEVFAATGQALSDLQRTGAPAIADWSAVALEPPRPALYARCDARLHAMVREGALEEVRALIARNLDPALPAMKAVGVREFAAHLRGETSLEAAVEAAQQETRRYAKRQITWMRGQMAGWPRLTADDHEGQWRQFLAQEPGLTP
ncbi:tRNA delta(2)-isopentenylpyrophosphate transferase [Phenylobacterium zucineum HLK1]|uniref:tRNA dimethylallyltransferase n=1 Tax=Phenylobacterium zucineum (strain HLK1) TaxID=450851 RepID=MIAA_PHEZH|nr:tRNA (adenosine(37)-N6)-dimethylallyltransferase MiaA [Phenylobacterium zucineum]B4RGS2.1 RecName: Full=tRNA dimethylallyltransferase; AltName: Full=Dimethylallyl diphosphate:tRNA dimethylallyltransferase; Short=DMAPP:tRNA dimethylallyltransferase; Short=DMATase; AltName: Full=Isopentenyl-diphosphate:tRNA isopentenyltransferase; Short=IPP transferase; Short=IPPT; Short=IPTase [Phenylobacterium zucineum HLK1]ACG77288.1 tRNA delta(2)-isopentenylpyrophosphate transferase [Phenylobacterium zucineu